MQRVVVKVFDGSENFSLSSYTTESGLVIYTPYNDSVYGSNLSALYSQENKISDFSTRDNYESCFFYNLSNINHYFRLNKADFPDIDTVKAWLTDQYNAGTPVTVYYELATPIPQQLTPVTIPTFPRTTIIEQTGEVKGNITATIKVND